MISREAVPGLAEILRDREARAERRAALAAAWSCRPIAVVQLTIAAPGRRKNGEDIAAAAEFGARAWEERAAVLGVPLVATERWSGPAGPCRLWVAGADPRETKSLIIGLEDGCGLGRLWDFDVYDERGDHVGRDILGIPPRRCYICGEIAAVCAGRRVHPIEEVERRFDELLRAGIGDRAHKAESAADPGGAKSRDA